MPEYHAPDHVAEGADLIIVAVHAMLVGYVTCAFWSDGQGRDTEGAYVAVNGEPLTPEAWTDALQDIAAFVHGNLADLIATGEADWEQHGHDFWLTRNGHGAGFWDRGYPHDVAERLSGASRVYGAVNLVLEPDADLAFFEAG